MANELSTKCQSSTGSSAEHAVILNSYSPTRNERLKACCKLTYLPHEETKEQGCYHSVNHKIIFFQCASSTLSWDMTHLIHNVIVLLGHCALLPGVSLVEWLADVILGQYRMIQRSIWIMWMCMMLSTASSVVAQLVTAYQSI